MNQTWKIIQIIFLSVILLYFNFKLFFSMEFTTPYNQIQNESNTNISEEKKIIILFDKGLIHKFSLEQELFKNLYPENLDNEHIPQRIFQHLSQDMKKNLISIIVIFVLNLLIILLIISMIYELSFYYQFRTLILLFILVSLFINLILIERPKLIRIMTIENNIIFFVPVIFDSLLIFFTTWFLMESSSKQKLKSFLDFYFHDKIELGRKIPQFLRTTKEMLFISIISVLITNIFLFPVFYIQIIYNVPFHILIILLLIMLAVYYIYAYYNVSKNREENPKIYYAISFLGFRIINNFMQILFFLIFFISLGIIISLIIIANNNLLENLNLIPRNLSL